MNMIISPLYLNPVLAHCGFDKSPTLPIILFELFILAGFASAFLILRKIQNKFWLRFLIMAGGVLLFELFTAPMWNNFKMGAWAYVYHDVSWILTIGWTSLILGVVLLVDKFFSEWKDSKRFAVYISILTVVVFILELIVVKLGIRSYSPEVQQAISGIYLFGLPLEILYYIPVFMTLVISFYKYWSFVIDDVPLVPLKHRKWLRSFLLAFLGIFLFEVMIEPMYSNEKLPQWSYIFHDVSILLTGMWIFLIWIGATLIAKFFMNLQTVQRYSLAVLITSALAWPIESWLINNGYRIYGPSTVATWTGFKTPITNVPVEIAFGIPIYMALVIAFIRYWETVIDNRL